ncbi:MAG: hypothetical protein AB1352_05325 [Patescibacteria group bacterium]
MDTVRLKIKNCRIQDPNFFCEEKTSRNTRTSGYKQSKTNNAFRKELQKRGVYAPRFDLEETNFGREEQALVIEFSAPKLINGHSLAETGESPE